MSGEQLEPCSVCGIGKLRHTGGLGTARDEEKDRVTTDYREYKCDNPECGYRRGGVARGVFQNNEDLNVTDSTLATVKNSDGSGEGDTGISISNKDDQQ